MLSGRSESAKDGAPGGGDAPLAPVIGLEIHVQLATRTKMFCRCAYHYGAPANTQVCPVCLGYPGALPVPNRHAVDLAVRLALALGANVAERSAFDRKSYFYPDLPKGYQITQLDRPLATGGAIPLTPPATAGDDAPAAGAGPRRIGLARLHLEEDSGKLIHRPRSGGSTGEDAETLIDCNRAGVPLVEIVTLPELYSPEEARDLLQTLRRLLRYLEVSDASMEEGSLRCDANVSLRARDDGAPGTKVEIKNLNSFRHVVQALEHEIERQGAVLAGGGRVVAETRGFDPATGTTHLLRSKEAQADYRYFPEPDLPPLAVDSARRARLAEDLPELPWDRRDRFVTTLDLPREDAVVLTESRALADYFERAVQAVSPGSAGPDAKAVADWVRTEVLGELHRRGVEAWRAEEAAPDASGSGNRPPGPVREPEEALDEALPPAHLASLVGMVADRTLSHSAAKEVLAAVWGTGEAPAPVVERLGLSQVLDEARITAWVDEVLEEHPAEVSRYLEGKHGLAELFVGQVMARSCGRADPRRVREILNAVLDARRGTPALSS